MEYEPDGSIPVNARAYAKFQRAGVYATTVTQLESFRNYLTDKLTFLMQDFNAAVTGGAWEQEIPYPYVVERGGELWWCGRYGG